MSAVLAAIADDYTGGTDVAVAFRRAGLRTLMFFGIPLDDQALPEHDALVVALKSRMASPQEAVRLSLAALRWLRAQQVATVYFKYCSTFDSTALGNIGPVLDALSHATGAETVVTTPSSPEHLRTQYQGHLFVGDRLLSESHMRNHSVTPMTSSNLRDLLLPQTREAVGLIPHGVVRQGPLAIRSEIAAAQSRHERYLITDAIDDHELRAIARAIKGAPLVAGASGLAAALGTVFASRMHVDADKGGVGGELRWFATSAVLAGSCSERTLEQLAWCRQQGQPSYRLDATAAPDPRALADSALAWYDGLVAAGEREAPVFYSSVGPDELRRIQTELGVAGSAEMVEAALGHVAAGLVERGVTRLVVAGGESAGSVVSALGVHGGVIGPEEGRGVPWILTPSSPHLALLLKSGGFGDRELLWRAVRPPESETMQAP